MNSGLVFFESQGKQTSMLGQNQQTKEKRRSAKMRNQSERISRVNEVSGQVRPQTKPFFHFVGIRDGNVPSKQFKAVQLVMQALSK